MYNTSIKIVYIVEYKKILYFIYIYIYIYRMQYIIPFSFMQLQNFSQRSRWTLMRPLFARIHRLAIHA